MCLFVRPNRYISTFRPYKPYIFGKLMTHPSPYTDPPSPPYGLLSLAQFTLSMFHHIFVSPQPNIIFKLQILFQNSSTIFTFRRPSVNKGDIPPSLHYMTFYTTQSIYFLKAYDQTRPDHFFTSSLSFLHQLFINCPLVHH